MRKTIAIIVVVLFAFAMSSLSFAVEEKKATPAPAAKKAEPAKPAEIAKVKYVSGVVKAADTAAQTITVIKKVKGKEEETVVTVDEKTSITMGKKKKELADVKVGSNVTVKYAEVEGKNVAKSISIKPVKKKATTAKKTK